MSTAILTNRERLEGSWRANVTPLVYVPRQGRHGVLRVTLDFIYFGNLARAPYS